ncbi:PCI domain-containing protein 2 [Thelohanellus kitauei]|uniref:PCI domain-containing protein 2 n=1 Tax=Thelohanellus kitauei TaxID=669202 RepID=A0A0C2J022_THEKT|nr:PCI domain-containing protein 2 [Thelohanellus kitauei]
MNNARQPVVVHPNILLEKIAFGISKSDGIQIALNLQGPEIDLFENIIQSHVALINELSKNDPDYNLILDIQCQKLSDLLTIININNKQKEFAPCIRILVSDIRKISFIVDARDNLAKNTLDFAVTERLIEYLMTIIRLPVFGANFTTPGSLAMANQMFQAYYTMNKYNLAMSLIKSFEQNPNYNLAIPEDLVHYKFLVGRFYLLVQDYKNAYINLKFAFNSCPIAVPKNKRLILLYLIPTCLKLGVVPSEKVHKFIEASHPIFKIVQSVKDGDMELFKSTIKSAKNEFVRFKLYFVICELKKMVLRTLYHRTFLRVKDKYQRFQIPISVFQMVRAFVSKSRHADFDKVCCELSILIFEGYIKGYISLAHKKIVFFIDNPFPTVKTVSFNKYEIDADNDQ